MKNVLFANLLVIFAFILAACNTQPIPTVTANDVLVEEQEFIVSPQTASLQTASTPTRAPRLVVRLSIQPELDKQGKPTGKRYGQAAFFWTDTARSKGGSNLGGTVSILLRDANNRDYPTSYLIGNSAPIMSNIDLYKQLGYEDHMVKTAPITFNGPLCVEVSSLNLLSTNGYLINQHSEFSGDYDSTPLMRLCDSNSVKSGTDLRLYPTQGRVFNTLSGTEFPLSMAIVNNGSATAKDITVTYKIPFAEQVTFHRDSSALFECSATSTQTANEGLVINISCYTEKLALGVQTLPLIFSATADAPSYNPLIEFYMNVSTSSPEIDMSNNTADSYVFIY
jgi:hypothetical protein